jgi:hypothetical protein
LHISHLTADSIPAAFDKQEPIGMMTIIKDMENDTYRMGEKMLNLRLEIENLRESDRISTSEKIILLINFRTHSFFKSR